MCCIPYIRFDDLRFGPTLCPSLRRSLNPVLPHRPAVFEVHKLVHRHVREGDADRRLLLLRLTHRRAPRERQAAPRICAVRGPVVLGRLFERPGLLVPLGAVGAQALQTLRRVLLVEAGEGDGLTAGVDAVHQVLLWGKLGLTAEREERLDPRPSTRRSDFAHLGVVGHPVGAMIASIVEPLAIVIEALTVALVIVHDVEVIGVDLEAPNGHGVVDADVPRSVNRQVGIDWHVAETGGIDEIATEAPHVRPE